MFIDGTTPPALTRTILMTADATGGVLTYALTLASELSRSGTKIHVAMMGPKPRPEQLAALRAVPNLVVHESTHALEWMNDPWGDVTRATEWLRGLEKQIRPDIVHLNGYAHAAAGFTAPVVIVAHGCLLSRWEALGRTEMPPSYVTYKEAVRRGLSAAAAVIAVSQWMRAALERHYGPLARIAVVPNGLTVDAPAEPSKESFVLAAGRLWDRAKNVETLARAARELPWPLKVVGSVAPPGIEGGAEAGWNTQPLTHPNVEDMGWLPPAQLGELMDRASIFASPTRYEPFGFTALEAALRGCALVLGDIPSLREVWADTAAFVAPDDEKGLVAAITKLANDRELRERLAAAANLRARLYTPARNARAMRDLYDAIIQSRRIAMPVIRGHEIRTP